MSVSFFSQPNPINTSNDDLYLYLYPNTYAGMSVLSEVNEIMYSSFILILNRNTRYHTLLLGIQGCFHLLFWIMTS